MIVLTNRLLFYSSLIDYHCRENTDSWLVSQCRKEQEAEREHNSDMTRCRDQTMRRACLLSIEQGDNLGEVFDDVIRRYLRLS